MTSTEFEQVVFNFDCDFELEEEDVAGQSDSDPLAGINDKIAVAPAVKNVGNNNTRSFPIKLNGSCDSEPPLKKLAVQLPLTPFPLSSRKKLTRVIVKPRPHTLKQLPPPSQTPGQSVSTQQCKPTTSNLQRATKPTAVTTPTKTSTNNATDTTTTIMTKLPTQNSSGAPHKKASVTTVNSSPSPSKTVQKPQVQVPAMPIIKAVKSLQTTTTATTTTKQTSPVATPSTRRVMPIDKKIKLETVSSPFTSSSSIDSDSSINKISLASMLSSSPSVSSSSSSLPQSNIPLRGRPASTTRLQSQTYKSNTNTFTTRLPNIISSSTSTNRVQRTYVTNSIAIKNGTNNSSSYSEPSDTWKYFKCSICDKDFWQETLLNEHIKRHNPVKPFKCTECERSYHTETLLMLHLESHTGLKPYGCHLCSQTFRRKNSLSSHLRCHQETRQPFVCAMCNKTFLRSGSLRIHQLNVHHVVLPLEENNREVIDCKPLL